MTDLLVTTPSDTEIVLVRDFEAPRNLVFDAWTKPELLKRWFGARGWHLVDCEVDLRVGGTWRFVSRGPGGAQMEQSGVYRQIERPEQLVYTESYDEQSGSDESVVTHAFTQRDATTRVTSTLRYASRQGRDAVLRSPMREGLSESYDRLATLLDTNSGRA